MLDITVLITFYDDVVKPLPDSR